MIYSAKSAYKYRVYKHTSPSGKVYIGITCARYIKYRWQDGDGYICCPAMYRAIQKYGWDNFTHEILYSGLTKEEAEAKERELIAYYNSTDPKYGYNILKGGTHAYFEDINGNKTIVKCKRDFTEYMRETWTKAHTGIPRSEETKEKIRKALTGRKRPKEVVDKVKATRKCKPVMQFTLDGEYIATYPSTLAAQKATGISMSRIRDSCIGRTLNPLRCRWKYVNEEDAKI